MSEFGEWYAIIDKSGKIYHISQYKEDVETDMLTRGDYAIMATLVKRNDKREEEYQQLVEAVKGLECYEGKEVADGYGSYWKPCGECDICKIKAMIGGAEDEDCHVFK